MNTLYRDFREGSNDLLQGYPTFSCLAFTTFLPAWLKERLLPVLLQRMKLFQYFELMHLPEWFRIQAHLYHRVRNRYGKFLNSVSWNQIAWSPYSYISQFFFILLYLADGPKKTPEAWRYTFRQGDLRTGLCQTKPLSDSGSCHFQTFRRDITFIRWRGTSFIVPGIFPYPIQKAFWTEPSN